MSFFDPQTLERRKTCLAVVALVLMIPELLGIAKLVDLGSLQAAAFAALIILAPVMTAERGNKKIYG